MQLDIGRPKTRLPVVRINTEPFSGLACLNEELCCRPTVVIARGGDSCAEVKHAEQAQRFWIAARDLVVQPSCRCQTEVERVVVTARSEKSVRTGPRS